MTDQQKGYGLGIILGIRLPCPRKRCAGAAARAAAWRRRQSGCCGGERLARLKRNRLFRNEIVRCNFRSAIKHRP